MNKMIDLLRCLLIVSFIYNAAITTALFCINSKLSDIAKPNKEKERDLCHKELAYTVVCIGKKPCSYYSFTKLFTIDKQYTVYKLPNASYPIVFDDDGTEWRVSQYDKLMLEAGGYLFGRTKEVNDHCV